MGVGAGVIETGRSIVVQTEWLYTQWWVWPVGVLLAGLAIGAVIAMVSPSRRWTTTG